MRTRIIIIVLGISLGWAWRAVNEMLANQQNPKPTIQNRQPAHRPPAPRGADAPVPTEPSE